MKTKNSFGLLLVSIFLIVSCLTIVQAYEPRGTLEDVVIDPITEESSTITGRGKYNDVIRVSIDDKVEHGFARVADESGFFEYKFDDKITVDSVIRLRFEERENKPEIIVPVLPVIISDPEVNSVSDEDLVVTGLGEVGRKVKLVFEDSTSREQIVDNDGNWEFVFDEPLAMGTKLSFYLHNDKGHKSDEVVVYVSGSLVEIEKPEVKDPDEEIISPEDPDEVIPEEPTDEVEVPTEEPEVVVPDEEVQIEEKPKEKEPIIEVKKEDKLPNTGISSQTAILVSTLVVSGVYLLYTVRKRKQ